MEVDNHKEEQFMEVDDDADGWSEEDDYDDYVEPEMEKNLSSYQPKLTSGFHFKIFTEVDIDEQRKSMIKEVQEVLGVSNDRAQVLLIKKRFDKDQVLNCCFEENAKIADEDEEDTLFDPSKDTQCCPVCFCDYPNDEVTVSSCNHFLCNTCFYFYLSTAVKNGPMCMRTTCPTSKCNELIPPGQWKSILEPIEYKTYQKFYMNYYVDCSKAIKWCPSPGCDKAIYYPELTAIDVFCECGKAFCFYCEQDAHVPVECYYRQMFMDKLRQGDKDGTSDSSELWMKVNSKVCPKCKSPIEKNQGCMHMTCYNCKYEFCWLCMGDYRNHSKETGIGLCNNYADLTKVNRAKKGELKEKVRLDMRLRKFAHYATRFKEHLKSVDLDKKRGEQLVSQIDFILAKSGNKYTLADFSFLNDVIELVLKARRAVANTYSMRFFMKGKRKKSFFDFMQGELELSLESLSRLLIKDITEFIEMGPDKSISLKEEFFKFKTDAAQIRSAVDTHFIKVLGSIKNDFPEVKEEEGKEELDSSDEDSGPVTSAKVEWTCYICTTNNKKNDDKCIACGAPRAFTG